MAANISSHDHHELDQKPAAYFLIEWLLLSFWARSLIQSSTSLSSQAVAIFPMRRLCGNRPSRIMRQIVVLPRGIDFHSSLNRMYFISVVLLLKVVNK